MPRRSTTTDGLDYKFFKSGLGVMVILGCLAIIIISIIIIVRMSDPSISDGNVPRSSEIAP